jgi:hypothetical protein
MLDNSQETIMTLKVMAFQEVESQLQIAVHILFTSQVVSNISEASFPTAAVQLMAYMEQIKQNTKTIAST